MPRIIYTVHAEFDDPAVRDAFVLWLRDDHASKVVAGGALSAEVTRLDPTLPESLPAVEVRYRFPDRAAFERYERDCAPTLRAEGLARFGPEQGVRMSRRVGELHHESGLREDRPRSRASPLGGFVR